MPIGSIGLLYLNKPYEALTTPFIVLSQPDPLKRIKDIWPEEWALPFRIRPLGSPQKLLYKCDFLSMLLSLRGHQGDWNRRLHINGMMVFEPVKWFTPSDWSAVVTQLVD
jgi:hypothetical protein